MGGKDNFQNVIRKYVSQNFTEIIQKKNRFANIVIIADKDDRRISEIEELHRKWLFPYAAKVVNLKWQESMFQDNFGNEQKSVHCQLLFRQINREHWKQHY